jgi:hypothetical protein
MSLVKFRSLMPFVFLLVGCDPVPLQYPPGGTSYPTTQPTVSSGVPRPGITGPQRGQYIWEKMLEGVAMGGSIAGPYGAGGGLIIGLLAGLFTADAHYAQLNAQIQSEQAKDKELEAQIEQEIERQRNLEAQLGNLPENPAQQKKPETPQVAQRPPPTGRKETTVAPKKDDPTAVASLGKKESFPTTPSSPFKNVEIRDVNGDGIPDLWIYYNPAKPGEIIRQEEDTNGDGKVDTWSYFNDGRLVRREVDTKGTGRPNTVYYYENDKIAREERDENGSGHVSFRAIYQNGHLAKVERDTHATGKIDLWVYYDTSKEGEVVSKEERDLNGDGAVDLWSYYEEGRLVRRDLSAVGLELLSKQDQIPSSPDPKALPAPGKQK